MKINPKRRVAEADRKRELEQLACDMLTTMDGIIRNLITTVVTSHDDEIPLTFQEIRVFKAVGANEPMTMNALASTVRVPLPTATYLVDNLVAKGVVVRTRTKEDRRLVLVSRSAKAMAREQKIFRDHAAMILNILEKLTPGERRKMAKALREIAMIFQDMPAAMARTSGERKLPSTNSRPRSDVRRLSGQRVSPGPAKNSTGSHLALHS
jgi:DNA-binding MarR family transcriptional regulator